MRNRTSVDEHLLAAAPNLRAVGRLGVGRENIDVAACERRGIAVLPATGANAVSVAEYVIAALLVLGRPGVFQATERVLAGEWPRQELVGHELANTRLGLIGFGATARRLTERARAFDMHVAAYDPYLSVDDPAWERVHRVTDLVELMRTSDAVSIHVPYAEETHHLIDGELLAQLPSHAVIINTARGGIVDEEALSQALRSGRIGGAALDVYEHEPPDPSSLAELAGLPNLVLTPHVAGITAESNRAVSARVADAIRNALQETAPVQEPG